MNPFIFVTAAGLLDSQWEPPVPIISVPVVAGWEVYWRGKLENDAVYSKACGGLLLAVLPKL